MMRRLLIVGCGDVALRAAPLLARRYRLYGLVHRPEQRPSLRARGITPIAGDLDRVKRLRRLGGLAHEILHLAPPPPKGAARSANSAPAGGPRGPRKSTTTPPVHQYLGRLRGLPRSAGAGDAPRKPRDRSRAPPRRRGAKAARASSVATGSAVSILRVPGIYAAERLPLARIEAGTPALLADEDSYLQPRARRRSRTHLRHGAAQGPARARLSRGRRECAQDGRLLRRGRRCVQPAAAASGHLARGAHTVCHPSCSPSCANRDGSPARGLRRNSACVCAIPQCEARSQSSLRNATKARSGNRSGTGGHAESR